MENSTAEVDPVYEKLRQKLETIGFGYPGGKGGSEYSLLTALFTPDEAELFCAMPNGYHSAEEIAGMLQRPKDEVAEKLEKMSLRGNLFRLRKPEGTLYRTIPVVHGLYEFSVPRVDPNWVVPFIQYVLQPNSMGDRVYGTDTPLLRALPASGTIEPGTDVMLIDNVDELIKSKKRIAVTKCLCRISMKMMGSPECKHTKETCMAFDEFADYYVENGFARYIDTEEALDIVHNAGKEGLVAQVGTSQRGEVLCNCCKCCCAVLACLRMFGGPAGKVCSNFYSVNVPGKCVLCGTCVERCPMGAISIEDGKLTINRDVCIGCGACATGCAQHAMFCRKKAENKVYNPPAATIFDSYSLQQVYRGQPA